MKKALKYLRSARFINYPVRRIVKTFVSPSTKLYRFFSVHWPVSGIIKTYLPDGQVLRFFSKGDDWIPTQLYWKGIGGYEGNSELLFLSIAQKSKCVIDVGANIGYFSLLAAVSNTTTNVFAFEPVPKVHERLLKNIRINKLSNISPEQLIVSDSCEPTPFYIPENEGIMLSASTKEGWNTKSTKQMMSATSLDDYKAARKISKIDLVKMDCEFHEQEVLEGMQQILKEDKPLILMEVLFPESKGVTGHFDYTQADAIEAIMKRNDYYFYLISDTELIRTASLSYNPASRNYLFSTRKSEKEHLPFSDIKLLIPSII